MNQILVTFEQLTAMPSECVRQMAVLARVLGERRICKLQVNLTSMQCNVYAVEHEPVSSALQVLGKVVRLNCHVSNWLLYLYFILKGPSQHC